LSYAQTQTNSGGEIVITQSGGYGDATGGLTITKSISIIAEPGVFAALAPTSGNGVTIATAGIKVGIRGLTVNGRGGTNGISVSSDASVSIEGCSISGFNSGGVTANSANAKVRMVNSVVRDNYFGLNVIQGEAAVAKSEFIGNTFGVGATPISNSTIAKVTIADSFITGSSEALIVYTSNTGSSAFAYASNVNVHSNNWGIDVGANGTVVIGGSSFMNNTYGHFTQSTSGVLKSANNNLLDNSASVSGTITNASATMFR
jgi:hypothetical protein